MSRVYEALRQMEKDQPHAGAVPSVLPQPAELLSSIIGEADEIGNACVAKTKLSRSSRLVALTSPQSLGAEKFRALVARLENVRGKREMKSLQITSGLTNEGKSMVAANLAVTFAKYSRSKVLLLEGDLHRPTMASHLGLTELRGLSHWWSGQEQEIVRCLYRLDDMPLWFLSAGISHEQPSHVLQSTRFTEAFARLAGWFDWILVDSTPMFPIADANLWSRLVDGTLLVVREGVASVKALKKGLESLDNLKLVGIVLNDASEFDRTGYAYHNYGSKNNGKS